MVHNKDAIHFKIGAVVKTTTLMVDYDKKYMYIYFLN